MRYLIGFAIGWGTGLLFLTWTYENSLAHLDTKRLCKERGGVMYHELCAKMMVIP